MGGRFTHELQIYGGPEYRCEIHRSGDWIGRFGFLEATTNACPENANLVGSAQCHCAAGYQPDATTVACAPIPVEEASCPIGNPGLPGTGRKLHHETDYIGAGAHPLTLRRLYRNAWTDGAVTRGLTALPAFEGGWRLSVQSSLTLLADAKLRAFRSDGSVIAFEPSSNVANTWVPLGGHDKVVATIDAGGTRTGFVYSAWANDQTESYDREGKLLTLRERNGWTTVLFYSDATTPTTVAPSPGLLIAVRNHFGRELRLVYDTQGRVGELLLPGAVSGTGAGSSTSPIRYNYGEASGLGPGVAARSQLTSVTWQDGTVCRYHYEDARFAQALTGITDESGQRLSTYSYDAQGRVTRSERVGGVDRVDFAYGFNAAGQRTTAVTDFAGPGGAAVSRSYTFSNLSGVLRPTAVTAPCPLCGNTQVGTTYDTAGNISKTIGHDGLVTFYTYDTKGRETERSTFSSSYQSATARPVLSAASKVVSTKWHATFNLPTQIAEPNKVTATTYSSNGMPTGQSWTATTDATGAAKFSAVKTGDTRSFGWSYTASSLNVTRIERINNAELARWTYAYNAEGVPIKLTDKNGKFTRVTAVDAHGRPTAGEANNNEVTYSTQYDLRGNMSRHHIGADHVSWRYGATGKLVEVTASTGLRAEMSYTSLGDLERLTANGQVLFPAGGTVTSAPRAYLTGALSRALGTDATAAQSSAAGQSSTGVSSNLWGSSEVGVTGNVIVGGAALNSGILTSLRTGETCPYVSMCWRAALGLQASVGGKIGVQGGPRCGKDWTDAGTQIQAVGDIVSPAGGVGASIGVGDRSLTGLAVGAGPGWGLGFSLGLEFCWVYVNQRACKNTPCECKGGSK